MLLRQAFLSAAARRPASTAAAASLARDGAWTLLAALEKAKEAEGVKVARLVSSLEALLPRPDLSFETAQHRAPPTPTRSTDPAFFSLPDPTEITRSEVVDILRATRRGRRIDLNTAEALLTAATSHFEGMPRVVLLPPLGPSQRLTVIGDLHGSLSDLEAVLGLTGDPTPDNALLFNGDLADRGDHGVEVIAAVCALALAFPGAILVNRGNHEDLALSVAYGLAAEVRHKYGPSAFRRRLGPLLDAFFRSLPLATVVEDDALIVHAGPPPPGIAVGSLAMKLTPSPGCGFSRTVRGGAGVEELLDGSDVLRSSSCADPSPGVEEIIEALLWSDPDIDEQDGTLLNHGTEGLRWKPNLSRGAGFRFDAGVVQDLLQAEGLSRLVRSHEPVHDGCARYTVGGNGAEARQLELFTVFSASLYPAKEGFNWGAVLTLQPDGKHNIIRYSTEDDDPVPVVTKEYVNHVNPPKCDIDAASIRRALRGAIVTRRSKLQQALEEIPSANSANGGGIALDDAVEVLVRVLNIEGEGLSQPGPRLALAKALSKHCEDIPPTHLDLLDALDSHSEGDGGIGCSVSEPQSRWLNAVFAFIDVDQDGVVSKKEWMAAVEIINANMPEGFDAIGAEDTWKILDLDGNGYVSASEWDTLRMAMCR